MTEIKAVLVDLDGTLADTAAANFAAYASALGEYGVQVDQATFSAVAFGRNWRQFLPELLAGAHIKADPAAVASRKAELYHSMLDKILVNTALVRLVKQWHSHCGTALVTTASAANANAILKYHNLADLFDVVITGDDVTYHKPNPEAYQLAAKRLRVRSAECLIFEDSHIGIAAARLFGADVIEIAMRSSIAS